MCIKGDCDLKKLEDVYVGGICLGYQREGRRTSMFKPTVSSYPHFALFKITPSENNLPSCCPLLEIRNSILQILGDDFTELSWRSRDVFD